ncbi:MAG: DUF4350 domain-containing protein [Desulfobacteraceae bacterium]|nr:DUF4350 domain-containing protein [Desulfobacteraceae bacterium]
MQRNKTIAGAVMALLLLFFVGGVTHLFVLRFESGDVYPAYSSLRSDPLGTRALYESLENIDSLSVSRNYHLLKSVTYEPHTTFFYLATSADGFNWVPKELIDAFDRLTQSGGRLVLTFLPVTKNFERKADKSSVKNKDLQVQIKEHWGIAAAFKDILPVKEEKHLAVEARATREDLPPVISWHTNLYFDLFDGAWHTLYSYEGRPLIVERPFGKGSILVCADTYFVSNEALWSERHPRLLVWLIGGHSNIIFDEAHFGIYKQPSVAQLIRRYRFHWFFAALAVLALLFVWKSAAYFVPPAADDAPDGADVVSEKDYIQGLIALLRRNIAGNQILQVCAKEWVQTFKKSKRIRSVTLERVRALEGSRTADSKKGKEPVNGYREISGEINRLEIYSRSRGKRI